MFPRPDTGRRQAAWGAKGALKAGRDGARRLKPRYFARTLLPDGRIWAKRAENTRRIKRRKHGGNKGKILTAMARL